MYRPTTAVRKILKLKKRIRVIQGGSSAGKTVAILMCLIDDAQSDKKPRLYSVVSETVPHLKRGAIRDFLSIMEAQGYYKDERWNRTDFVYTFETGSKIEFFSADSPDKVRGPRRDILFINECNNVSYETYTQLSIRTNGFIYLDYNPVAEFWVHEDIIPKVDHDFIILTYKDNEGLPETIVQELESRRHRVGWWKVYGEGQLGEVEGRIYTGWNVIDEIPHEARLERYGLDFGWNPDPAAIIAIYYWNGGYILDEVAYQLEMPNREIANTLKNLPRGLVVADSAEPKSIEEIRGFGINIVPTPKGADSVRHGIKAVQDQRISYTRRSVNLAKEYSNYLWDVDKEGKIIPGVPAPGRDHLLDAARYAINSLIPVQRRREMIVQSLPQSRVNIAV